MQIEKIGKVRGPVMDTGWGVKKRVCVCVGKGASFLPMEWEENEGDLSQCIVGLKRELPELSLQFYGYTVSEMKGFTNLNGKCPDTSRPSLNKNPENRQEFQFHMSRLKY